MNANVEESQMLAEVGCEPIDFIKSGRTIEDSLGLFSLIVDTSEWKVQRELNQETSSIILGREDSTDIPTVMVNMGPLKGKWNLESEIVNLEYQAEIIDNGKIRIHNLGSFYWFRIRESDPFMEFIYLVEPDTVKKQLFSILYSTMDKSNADERLCELEGITVGIKKIE